LPARISRYLRTEIFLLLLAFPLCTAGCGPREVWGTPLESLKERLGKAQYQDLASVDFSTQDPEDALAIDPRAPYYLSFVFDKLGKAGQSQRMLELAWQRSPSPWKEEAGMLLGERALDQKSWSRAAEIATELLSRGLSTDMAEKARRILVEAEYWSKEDETTLMEASRLSKPDAEVLLFRAVASLRLGRKDARDLVLQLFSQQRVSSLHGRAYSFIAAEPTYLALFAEPERGLLAAKNDLVQGDWAKGIPRLEQALETLDPALFADGVLVVDLGASYGYAGRQAAGAKSLERLSSRLTGQARMDALEQAGKLARRVSDYNGALRLLRAAADGATSAAQRDRARWFILDVLLTLDQPDLASRIEQEAASWADPSYFADLLEERISELVAARDWKALVDLRLALERSGPEEINAELSYVLARASQEGYLGRLGASLALTPRELFDDARRLSPAGYYGTLASSMLGALPDRAIPSSPAEDQGSAVEMDPLIMGFIPFGLSETAYARLWAQRDALSDAQLLEAARRFAEAGDVRSSMYLVGVVSRRRRLSLPELELYYPKAYSIMIEPLATGAGISFHILYGLVREESYFDPDIVSSAGAVGLSQLMPATAAAIAKSMRLQNPDLRDALTNLMIGVRHLKDVLESVDAMLKALLAYNAGLSRVRQWERAAKGLPLDLFAESVPIAETRGYARKILVSSVMYAFLYQDADPREAALSFFSLGTRALERGPE
jgi:soluble lytic murein transglycosylase-like protein